MTLEKRHSPPFRPRLVLPRRFRASFISFFVLLIIATVAFLYRQTYTPSPIPYPDDILAYLKGLPEPEGASNDRDPPRFYEWHDREKRLPQHDPALPFPQGREGRYIYFANQACCIGWGNVMQGILLEAHLAYLSGRTYVFQNYTWDRTAHDYSWYGDKRIPARVPLTALLSGPIAGDPFPSSSGGTPAVIVEFFKEVCPNPTVIDPAEINDALPGASGANLVQAWLDKLDSVEDRCVEIKAYAMQVFDFMLLGDSSRLLDIWPAYSKSPILTHFGWSPLIMAALAANAPIIHPSLSSLTPSSFSPYSNPTPLSGLLALHVRRGDYVEHCLHLAKYYARFMGFDEFPGLPDRFSPWPTASEGRPALTPEEEEEEHQALYRAHCFPDTEQIVSRVREVRRSLSSATRLTRMYVLTNGRPEWLQELEDALQEDAAREQMDPWEHIATSRDLRLTREQQRIGQAIDMAVAQRAEVFLGTGFSSMTSNVVMLRAAQGFPWDKTRFL